jgi:hypothetical protein
MLTSHTPFQRIFGMRMWMRDNAMGSMFLPEAAANLDARSRSQTVVAQKFESPDKQSKLVVKYRRCLHVLCIQKTSFLDSQ